MLQDLHPVYRRWVDHNMAEDSVESRPSHSSLSLVELIQTQEFPETHGNRYVGRGVALVTWHVIHRFGNLKPCSLSLTPAHCSWRGVVLFGRAHCSWRGVGPLIQHFDDMLHHLMGVDE